MINALMGAGIVLLFLIAAGIAGSIGWGAIKFYRQIKKLNDTMSGVPALLEGIMNICRELSSSTIKMTTSVDKFGKTVLAPEESGPRRKDGFMAYDDMQADRSWALMQMMERDGISEEQARERIALAAEQGRFVVRDE